MNIQESKIIPGLKGIKPDVFHDFRGEYLETFNAQSYRFTNPNGSPIQFVEDDVSVSRQHVLRGLHGDSKTWKLIQCLSGEFYYVVADMWKESPAYLKWEQQGSGAMENNGNHGGVVFAWGWEIVLGAKNGPGSSEFQNKAGVRMKKSLRFIGAERKSRKNVHLDRGQETKWEISINYYIPQNR